MNRHGCPKKKCPILKCKYRDNRKSDSSDISHEGSCFSHLWNILRTILHSLLRHWQFASTSLGHHHYILGYFSLGCLSQRRQLVLAGFGGIWFVLLHQDKNLSMLHFCPNGEVYAAEWTSFSSSIERGGRIMWQCMVVFFIKKAEKNKKKRGLMRKVRGPFSNDLVDFAAKGGQYSVFSVYNVSSYLVQQFNLSLWAYWPTSGQKRAEIGRIKLHIWDASWLA